MTSPIRIWICAAYHPVYHCGGWAAVRAGQGAVLGVAGGERQTTASRMALSGLAAALRDLPLTDGHDPIGVQTTSPELAGFAPLLASLAQPSQAGAPDEDLDLWARISTAAKGRRLDLVRIPHAPATPIAFAAAWAELARDKVKAAGPFTSAIPKPNLAQVPGLAA